MFVTPRALFVVLAGLIPIVVAPVPQVVALWAAFLFILILIDVVFAPSPRNLAVTRKVPASVRLGQAIQCQLIVTNTGRRRIRGTARDAWQPSAGAADDRHTIAVPPGESRRYVTHMVPWRRGDRIASAVTIRSRGPLRLAGRQRSIEAPARLRVLPAFISRKHLPSRLARLRELDGQTSALVRGQGSEFDSLREYVKGDDVRSIDWRATARRQEVVVRTWRPERDRRVMIVIDTGRLSAIRAGDGTRLEAQIEAALLLGAVAGHAGDRVEVMAIDRKVRIRVASATKGALLPLLADAIAPIEPQLTETDWALVAATVRQRLSQRSLVVLLTSLDPAAVEDGLLPSIGALTRDHVVVIANVADPEIDSIRLARSSPADVYDAAAAERITLEREMVGTLLKRARAEIVDAAPDDLAPALVDCYLALKVAGRL